MNRLQHVWQKKWVRRSTYFFTLFIVLFLLRGPILRGMGNFLVAEDTLHNDQAFFILGGNSYDRGMKALDVFQSHPNAMYVCSGGNYPTQIKALDTLLTEAALTDHLLRTKGVPDANTDVLDQATSTREESDYILNYCKEKGFTQVTIISSAFHLRRVKWVFEEKFNDAGITTHYLGSADGEFDPNNWWKDETGLITCCNEFIKLAFYGLKGYY